MVRLEAHYKDTVVPALIERFGYSSAMQVPRIEKITLNMGLGEALTDKNGEVWAGELHGGRFARLDPETERWTEYVLPEPYAHNRRTWIDNVTDPVTVWYVDHNGYMVRIQPLE